MIALAVMIYRMTAAAAKTTPSAPFVGWTYRFWHRTSIVLMVIGALPLLLTGWVVLVG